MMDKLKKLYIEPTSKCNLSCTMCFRKTWIDEPFADMDIEVFERILSTMPEDIETIFFGGMGEPLFHKNIIHMVKSAANLGKRVELLTNGTMLTAAMSAALQDAGLKQLWVSIDSFDVAGYETIRQNSNFALIKNNISKFNLERYKREDEVSLGIAFVAMKSNVEQLGELARFAYKNHASDINISNVIPTDRHSVEEALYSRVVSLGLFDQEDEGVYPNVSLPMMDTRIPGVWEGVMGLLRADSNIMFNGVPLSRRKKYCKFIEEGNAFVRHDGDVSPCMALLHSAVTFLDDNKRTIYHHAFGNVKTQRLDDIWSGEEYSNFRNRVKNFEFSPCTQCGGCEKRDDNLDDCLGNPTPTCGACLWSEGIISCP